METNNKFRTAHLEFELVQKQMDKYDDISTKIKTWALTLEIAITGWALQSQRREFLLLGVPIILTSWALEAIHKSYRQDYKKRRNEIIGALNIYTQTEN